jgi:hypothetical protein
MPWGLKQLSAIRAGGQPSYSNSFRRGYNSADVIRVKYKAAYSLLVLLVSIGHAQAPREKMIRSDDLQQDKGPVARICFHHVGAPHLPGFGRCGSFL